MRSPRTLRTGARALRVAAVVGLVLASALGSVEAASPLDEKLDVDPDGGIDFGCRTGESCRVSQDVVNVCVCENHY